MLSTIQNSIGTFASNLASFTSVIIECVGVIIIVLSIIKYAYRAIVVHKCNIKEIHSDKGFNTALSVALEVLLASEILKTLTLDGSFDSLIEVVLLIVVRILMAVVLRFENKS